MEERTMMETVGLICFRRCNVSLPASPSMDVSTRTRTGSNERKTRRASCSLEATVTSKLRRDRWAARYLAIATSSSTISTRVLGFIHAPSGNKSALLGNGTQTGQKLVQKYPPGAIGPQIL